MMMLMMMMTTSIANRPIRATTRKELTMTIATMLWMMVMMKMTRVKRRRID